MPQLIPLNRLLFSLFLLTIYLSPVFPQSNTWHFEDLSVEKGLPSNAVNSVYQDKKGFIWIGTNKGLVRYDGYSFRVFQHKPNDKSSISNDIVTSIIEDSVGNLWVGTLGGGLNKYDHYLNKFYCIRNNPTDSSSIINDNITALFVDKQKLWAGTWYGISELNFGNNKFKNYYSKELSVSGGLGDVVFRDGFGHASITKIIKDNNVFWISTLDGITEFNPRNKSFVNYRIDKKEGFQVRSIIKEDESNLLIASDDGLFRFNKSSKQFTPLFREPVNDLLKTKEGKLWCATSVNGIILYDIRSGTLTSLTKDAGSTNGIVSNSYKNIFMDKAGSLWFSSLADGINMLHPVNKKFNVLKHEPLNKNSLAFNSVNKGFTDENNVSWFPTDGGGLDKYDCNNKSFQHLSESSLKENKVSFIFKDNRGNLLAGTNAGLYTLTPNSNSFEKIPFVNPLIKDKPVRSAILDKYGNIWFSVNDNLIKYSTDKTETIIGMKPDSLSVVDKFEINDIVNDYDNLWISTTIGLFRYDIQKNSLSLFRDKWTLDGENNFRSIVIDNSGRLWFGSMGGGLKCFYPYDGKITSYKYLPSNNILSVLEDSEGFLWLGTDKGLIKFNKTNGNSVSFTIRDGLPGNQFIQNASWKSPSGEFFFGTTNGLVSFFPGNILNNSFIPPVVITSFKIFNKEAPLGYDPSYINEIEIPYDQNFFSLEVSALNFIEPEGNQYSYKLEGINNEWINIRSIRDIFFTNLEPGTYNLRIKAANNDGLWNESGLSVKLIILPPWYRSWWAYIIYLIIIVALYFAIRRYELNKMKLRNELEMKSLESQKLVEADKVKSDFFANISHEFRTPLTLIIEPVVELKNRLANMKDKTILEMVERNATRLLQLIDQLLDLSKLEAGSMKLQVSRNDIIPFLRGLVMNFESAAKLKNISLVFYSAVDHLNIYFDSDKIEKIIFNLISNAVKFTPSGGNILISAEVKSERLYVTVKDNGVGIQADKLSLIFNRFYQTERGTTNNAEGTGIGLALTKELVELHKGEIKVKSGPAQGAAFTFWIHTIDIVYKSSEITEQSHIKMTYRPVTQELESPVVASPDYGEKQIVLLVEDNADMRRFIASLLEEIYVVFEAPNGKEGLEKSIEVVPDIIISDVMMPEMDNLELCRLLKSNENTSHIPVILLTAKAAMENKITSLETGADEYLVKPFNKLELLVRIKNLIDLKRKLRDKISQELIAGIIPGSNGDKGLNKIDRAFIEKVLAIVEKNHPDPDFDIEHFCRLIGMSQTQLRRKMSALFNKSPIEFITGYRLNKAARLIREEGNSISEAAFAVGFNNLSYFTKCYRAEFGKLPSDPGPVSSKNS